MIILLITISIIIILTIYQPQSSSLSFLLLALSPLLGMNHVSQLSKKGINTLGKVSSQIGINITLKELDEDDDEDDDDDKTSATTKQSSTSSTLPLPLPPLSSSSSSSSSSTTTNNNLFNEQQCDLIRYDLQIIFDAYIKYDNDEKIMEVLRFFNSTILSIIDNNNNNNNNNSSQVIDSKKIEHILKTRFLIAVSYVFL